MWPAHKKLIALLALVAVLEILSPAAQRAFIWFSYERGKEGRIRADFPSGWEHHDLDSLLTVSDPCWTVFCSDDRSTFAFSVPQQRYPSYDRVVDASIRSFAERHSGTSKTQSFPTRVGAVECFQGRAIDKSTEVMCISRAAGFEAHFLGSAKDLPRFYHAVESIRIEDSK